MDLPHTLESQVIEIRCGGVCDWLLHDVGKIMDSESESVIHI